jgi:hypothetical protein
MFHWLFLPGGTVGVGPELAEDSHTVQVADLTRGHKWSFKNSYFFLFVKPVRQINKYENKLFFSKIRRFFPN